MPFYVINNSNEPQFMDLIGLRIGAKQISRAISDAEYQKACKHSEGYAWASFQPVMMEAEVSEDDILQGNDQNKNPEDKSGSEIEPKRRGRKKNVQSSS